MSRKIGRPSGKRISAFSQAISLRRRTFHVVCFVLCFVAVALLNPRAGHAAQPPSFQGIGMLPGSQFGSVARALSDDGTAVLGHSDQSLLGGSFFMSFRWQDGVMIPLGDLPGDADYSEPGSISADGSTAAGMSFSSNGTEAFHWQDGVMIGVGDLPGGPFYSHAFGISGDGSCVVGLSHTGVANFPFRWCDGVIINLSDGFPEGLVAGFAVAASFDGNVVVGMVSVQPVARPFRWDNGVMSLLDLPPGSQWGSASAVSPDGSYVVGSVTHAFEPMQVNEAFAWHEGKMSLLGDLPGGEFQSSAADVSGDGNVIVGTSSTAVGSEPFIWTPTQGMSRLRDVLELEFNLDLTGWLIDTAVGVSADGLSIAGTGINPAGKSEAWLAHIGCAVSGDFDNDGLRGGSDVAGLVRCLIDGLGCGCGDMTGDGVVNGADIGPFIDGTTAER